MVAPGTASGRLYADDGAPGRPWGRRKDRGEVAVAMSNVLVVAAGTAEHARSLPFSAVTFGAISLIAFVALLGLTWSFRNTSNRHR